MNKKVLKTLEYDKIVAMLVEEADSPLGKESAGHLLPSARRNEIIAWQTETSHALMRVLKQGKLSFHGLRDIRPSLVPLEKGGTLGMGELLDICRCLEIAGAAIRYNEKEEELQDALTGRFTALAAGNTPLHTQPGGYGRRRQPGAQTHPPLCKKYQ